MARRKKRNPAVLIGVVLIAVIAAVVWNGVTRLGWRLQKDAPTPSPIANPVAETAADGHKISVSGTLSVPAAARDDQLGISADAAVLFRNVEMYQWREQCAGDVCRYDLEWSPKSIDASKFRVTAGHENPNFPFVSTKFSSGPIKLGAYVVDPELLAEQLQPQKKAVRPNDLPPNLAATFRESDGILFTGEDFSRPQAGALRVSYRVIPVGETRLTGVQHGQRLSTK